MAKDVQKQIVKLNKKVDSLILKYKKLNDTKKKKKDKEFMNRIFEYYTQFDDEEQFFAALDVALTKKH